MTEPVILTLLRKTVQDIELLANSLDVQVSLGASVSSASLKMLTALVPEGVPRGRGTEPFHGLW